MRESIMSPDTNLGMVGRFRREQIANRATWGVVPDADMIVSHMYEARYLPANQSTITLVNPLDPATVPDVADGWLQRPAGYAPVVKAGH